MVRGPTDDDDFARYKKLFIHELRRLNTRGDRFETKLDVAVKAILEKISRVESKVLVVETKLVLVTSGVALVISGVTSVIVQSIIKN